MRNLANLDLLRSIAVMLVVGSHVCLYSGRSQPLGPWMGVSGVYLFFVHTSLVLMASLARDPHPGRFYLRRVFRIYPLWLAVLLIAIAIKLPTSPFFAPSFRFYAPGFRELLANIFLLFDLHFGARVIGASWTLPIEVQMYLVLPFLYFLVRSTGLLWPVLALQCLAMAAASSLTETSLLITCAPFFFPGVLAYFLTERWKPRLPGWSFLPALLLLIVLMAQFGRFKMAWLLTLLLGLGLPVFHQLRQPVLNRVTHLIARYSYGIYLGHLFAIALAVHVLRDEPLVLRLLAFFGTLGVLPVLLYHSVEKPMIQLGSRLAARIGSGREPAPNEGTLSLEPAP